MDYLLATNIIIIYSKSRDLEQKFDMYNRSHLAEAKIKVIAKDFEEGLTPAIEQIKQIDLTELQQEELLGKLDRMEELALQLKAKVKNG